MAVNELGTVYLLHFDPPLKHAKHYAGWTSSSPADRLFVHEAGRGARIVGAAADAGCEIKVVRVWENVTRAFERKVKKSYMDKKRGRMHNGSLTLLCPSCCARVSVVGGVPSQLFSDYTIPGQIGLDVDASTGAPSTDP